MQTIISLLILVFFGIFIYTWYQFHSALRPQKKLKKSILNSKLEIIKKTLTTSDGIQISSWYIPVNNPKAVIILIHGYKEANADKTRMLPHAEYLKQAGYSTILIDLRFFGESGGNRISLGINEWKDVKAAYDYAKSLPENRNKKIGFFGKSMGGVSSIIAKGITGKGDFIVALTPYSSFKSLFSFQLNQKGYPSLIFLPFLRFAAFFELGINYEKYSPINLVEKINAPIFVTSAKRDEIVPPQDAKKIYDKAKGPKEFWQSDTIHATFSNDPLELKKRVLIFLSKNI